MHLCLFEDGNARNFFPLTHFRPVYDLRCGMFSARERGLRLLAPSFITLHARTYLTDLLAEQNPASEVNRISSSEALLLNGRCLLTTDLARKFRLQKSDALFLSEGKPVAARLSGEKLKSAIRLLESGAVNLAELSGIPTIDVEAELVSFPWDLIYANERMLAEDFGVMTRNGKAVTQNGNLHRSAVLVNKKNIFIGKDAVVSPGVVLDATSGPIYIDRGVKLFPLSVVEGPCYVGENSQIKIGAKIYGNTSIGPVCKVGGEVEHAILHSHANKQHDGFLGHSYLSMWVNLGAGTTTSNLKNTYGPIKVHVNGSLTDSGKMFVGLTAGDHAKTGINATLDTGTVIGSSSNIYGTDLPPKYIPPFSWGDAHNLVTYEEEKALEVAVKVMKRRNIDASDAYRKLFRFVYEMTKNERAGYK